MTTPLSKNKKTALMVAKETAIISGEYILSRFNTDLDISFKGRTDIVTDADTHSEELAITHLNSEYPDHNILSEESDPFDQGSDYTWIIDPIDGTKNYAAGIPHFCVVVALGKMDPATRTIDIITGVTFDPVRNEMFTAVKGEGAYLNDKPIKISSKSKLLDSILGFDLGYVDDKATSALAMIHQDLWPDIQGFRLMGSSALGLAYAACNRIDLYFHHSLSAWDVASGLLLVREAGGEVQTKFGDPANIFSGGIIASNPSILEDFKNITSSSEWRLL